MARWWTGRDRGGAGSVLGRGRVRRFVAVTVLVTAAVAGKGAFAAGGAPVASGCTRYASPSGNDVNDGSTGAPFRTFQKLADSLTAGSVGCLRSGTYPAPAGSVSNLTKGGTTASPATLRAAPGADVTFQGRLVLKAGAHDLVVAGLKLDGTLPAGSEASSVTVLADDVSFVGNDITAPTKICVAVGEASIGQPAGSVITGFVFDGNRVHHCGDGLPRDNQEHGIYLQKTMGAIVRNNIFDHNHDRGVQLYPDADTTLVENNVIDANETGINLGGDPAGNLGRSEGNTFRRNLITNSSYAPIDPNFEGSAAPAGSTLGNVFDANCIFGGVTSFTTRGFSYTATNKVVDPQYNNQATGDYRLKATSPCIGKGLRPGIERKGAGSVTKTSFVAEAYLNPHRMTATYFVRVRLCSDADCTSVGAWSASAEANLVGTVDEVVTRPVSGLSAGRTYQYQFVARQALLPASNPDALVLSGIGTVTAAK